MSMQSLAWQLVLARSIEAPDRPAIEHRARTITFGELAGLMESAAAILARRGVGRGDRVVIGGPTSPEKIINTLAVVSRGAIAVPIGERTGRARLDYIVETMDPRCCLLEEDACSRPPRAWISTPNRVESGACAMVLFSSGSTGRPKGVVLTHENLGSTARMLASVYGLTEGHRELILCPISHSDGWQRVAATLQAGGTVVIGEKLVSVRVLLEDIARLRIEGFFIPPSLARSILAADRDEVVRSTATCRTIEIGSAPIGAGELRELMDRIPTARVFVHYGLTECSRAVILDARANPDKLHTVGRPAPDVALSITERGIALNGPQRFARYWGQPELTSERIADGCLLTGDLGGLDEDGFLILRGRKDDMISALGYHFFPAEVETELGPVEGIEEYVIAGVRDPKGMEDVPWAFAVARGGGAGSPKAFLSAARERLSPHMVPRNVVLVPSIPYTEAGKPDRRRVVELYGEHG
jgi:acyl-CoA synthetase (AMP-forming)/AMP-acid ligase II